MMKITYSDVYTVESTWWSLHGGVEKVYEQKIGFHANRTLY